MAAIMAPRHQDLGASSHPDERADSDLDAEGEEDTDLYQLDQELQSAVQKADAGSVADEDEATAESDDGAVTKSDQEDYAEPPDDEIMSKESDNDDFGNQILQRLRRTRKAASDEQSDPDVAFEKGDARSDSDSTSNGSDIEGEDWEAESNEKDENDADKLIRSNCM